MLSLDIQDAAKEFPRCLEALEQGKAVMLCRHSRPYAEIRPLHATEATSRPIGLAKGLFEVPDAFFDDLPEDELAAFEAREP